MRETCAAQNDAASDVDVIACRNEIAEDVKEFRHCLPRKDVAGKENAGKKGEECELYGFGLGIGLAGNKNTNGKGDEEIRQGEKSKQQYISVDRNLEHKAHEGDNGTELRESDKQIG